MTIRQILPFASLALCTTLASAYVAIDPARVEAGTTYRGVVRVAHGCESAPMDTLELRLPAAATALRASASPHWQSRQSGNKLVWTAGPGGALGPQSTGEFAVEFRAPKQAGPLWLELLQKCGRETVAWSERPAPGASAQTLKHPALLLQVVSAQDAAALSVQPAVEGAWVRASVPGQQATGAFMRITAKVPTQLVGISTPVAGNAAVHEMRMEGDVMRMRPAGPIALPAGRAFELKPGGYHLMLQGLKQPLEKGGTVPLTLVFRDATGVESRMDLHLPVALQPPAGGMAPDHKR